MHRREMTNQAGETWILLSDSPIDDEGTDFVAQIRVGTTTAMNFWGTITVEIGTATEEQILAAMIRTEEAWADLLA